MYSVIGLWGNGGRPLLIAFGIFVASLLMLGSSLFVHLIVADHDEGLGRYASPWLVLNSVNGIEGPAVYEGDLLSLRGERCVKGGRIRSVLVYLTYQSDDVFPSPLVRDLNGEKESRAPGCVSANLNLRLPTGVKPGRWHVEQIERDTGSGELRTWYSETFQVVPR